MRFVIRRALIAVVMMSVGFWTVASAAQTTLPPVKPDPQIQAAMKQVKAQTLEQYDLKLVSFGTRNTLSANMPVAGGKGIAAAREWIRAEFESISKQCNGCLEVKLDSYTQQPTQRVTQPTEVADVYAIQRGTDPAQANRIVLVTGHYDSRATDVMNATIDSPGANDDGSGTVVSLECARVLSKYKFPATIIYLSVAGEEQGLFGSHHFAQMAKEQGWKIEAVLNDDTVGGDKSPGQDTKLLRVFSEGIPATANEAEVRRIRMLGAENDSPSRELARYIRGIGGTYLGKVLEPVMIYRQDRFLRGGDHTSFNQAGYPAVRLTEWRENFNHQHQTLRTENGIEYGDLPKFVDFDYLANVARLNVATLASLALAPAPPTNVKIETRDLTNESTLRWQPAAGAAEYEIVWRATDAPEWQHLERAGNVDHYTVNVSKDNVIFGVRSSDGKGHHSPAVMPLPQR